MGAMKLVGRLDPPLQIMLSKSGILQSADTVIMHYHYAAGGEQNGQLALPDLLNAARHCAQIGVTLSRALKIADQDHVVNIWCDLTPTADGVEITISDWRETPNDRPHNIETANMAGTSLLPEPLRTPCDGYVRLDAHQRIISIDFPAAMQTEFADNAYVMKRWFEFFALTDPLETLSNWEIFRNHIVRFPGDDLQWKITAEPRLNGKREMIGYEMRLTAHEDIGSDKNVDIDTPGPESSQPPLPVLDKARLEKIFGGQIGPALRQPIGRIIANAETIGGRLQGPIRSDYANYASDIADAGRHLLALVEDLTDLEAIDSADFKPAHEDIDLADLARRAAGLLALRAAEHQIRIDTPAHDETLVVIGEFRRVLQILLNLLGNAINYSPIGSMIWLRLDDEVPGHPHHVGITVADQGNGISMEEQQRLFHKWERLGRSGDGGSGLGLYISKRLAVAMSGDILIDSAPGQGARFTLLLPRA